MSVLTGPTLPVYYARLLSVVNFLLYKFLQTIRPATSQSNPAVDGLRAAGTPRKTRFFRNDSGPAVRMSRPDERRQTQPARGNPDGNLSD